MEYKLNDDLLVGFQYPPAFLKLIELNLIDLDLWFILDSKLAERILHGMRQRYPHSDYIPFAKRADNDDVACFEPRMGSKVQIVHDFASEGWERRERYESVWNWFELAIHTMVEYNLEEERSS